MAVLGMNQGTSAYINFDLVGTVNTQVVGVGYGTVSTIGTLPNLPGGSIAVTAGTGIVTGGSIVVTAGTVAAHAITAATITEGTLRNLISGTINAATAVLNSGTINVATAVVSSLPNLPQGSIQVTAGTFTAGTLTIAPLSGVFLAGTLGVGTTATALPASALSSRKSLILYNNGTIPIYLGGSGVTTATGFPVLAGDSSPSFEVGTTILYGIATAVSGGTVTVLEAS